MAALLYRHEIADVARLILFPSTRLSADAMTKFERLTRLECSQNSNRVSIAAVVSPSAEVSGKQIIWVQVGVEATTRCPTGK